LRAESGNAEQDIYQRLVACLQRCREALGVEAAGASVDIADGAALKSWIANVAREFGGIDMLFSNAGAMAQGGDLTSWEQNFRLDVLGAVNAFEAARPFLEASGAKSGDAAFVIIFIGFGSPGRHRQFVWSGQSGAGTHGEGTCASVRRQENPRERRVSRHCLF
jgi:NAD(P)-dependent dehydrogenase (short-subunit alcohol dehydrogenase family)